MNRAQFLRSIAGAAVGVTALGRLTPATAAPILEWPTGTFVHEAGALELGIMRDSVLTATNDFQIFAETFESVAAWTQKSPAVTR